MSDLEGVMLSEYLLMQCISKGGIADVYRARIVTAELYDGAASTEVVVKVFRPTYAQREAFREYFMSEADKIGQFEHPNILPYLEYGEGEDLLYFVTPYVATGTLDTLLQRVGGRFSAMQALPIMQQLCSAVQYAHDHGVVHGNIKPTNIFVAADGHLLLSDFGIARGYDDSQQSLTRVGWGSAEYAAPEQSLGLVKRSSDIYALGVLLFRLLTGTPPFTGQTPVEVLLKHVRQQPPSARSLVPYISDAVDGVLRMAMQKRADDRFASATELSDAFLAAVTVSPVASPVARSVVPGMSSLPAKQMPLSGPLTPFPTSIANPQTPVPPSIAFQPLAPADDATGDTTVIRKKHFLQEDSHDNETLFWSANPAEWSPLAQDIPGGEASSIPLTAGEYLESKPLATPLVPPVVEQPVKNTKEVKELATGETPDGAAKPELAADEQSAPQQKASFATHLHRLLPIIVVVLLLLGLLGALLSAFFFPGGKSGANHVAIPMLIHAYLAWTHTIQIQSAGV